MQSITASLQPLASSRVCDDGKVGAIDTLPRVSWDAAPELPTSALHDVITATCAGVMGLTKAGLNVPSFLPSDAYDLACRGPGSVSLAVPVSAGTLVDVVVLTGEGASAHTAA